LNLPSLLPPLRLDPLPGSQGKIDPVLLSAWKLVGSNIGVNKALA